MNSIVARNKPRSARHFSRDAAAGSVSIVEMLIGRKGSISHITRSLHVAASAAARRSKLFTSGESSDPTDFSSSSTKQRFPWGSRKASISHQSKVRESMAVAGKKRPTNSPKVGEQRRSTLENYAQTDRRSTISPDRRSKPRATRLQSTIAEGRDSQWRRTNADDYSRKKSHTQSVQFKTAPIVLVRKTEERLVTTKCNSGHEGRKLLQERLMVEVDVLFKLLFTPSQFLQNFHDKRQTTDLRMGNWSKNASGQNERTVTMTVALAANVGPKTAKVTETQTLRECSQPGQLYSIDVRSVNAEIPYADTFEVQIHFCLKATEDEETDVLIFAQIKFVKSVWAVVKAFIEKNAYAGLDEFAQSLFSSLLNEIKKM